MIKIAFFILGIFIWSSKSAPSADLVNKTLAQIPAYVTNTMYAGYLNVSSDKKFYYWFIEKDSSPETAPVVLWLNGGPGCSSLLGATSENGPFLFNDGAVGFKSNPNLYAWTKLANVIYMESPGGVGFSIGPQTGNITDYQTGVDNKNALLSFFQKFPEFKLNSFYISGESYAGTYIPYTALAIDEENKAFLKINLKGWAVGNGCTHPTECVNSQIKFTNDSSSFIYDFLYNQNKFSESTYKDFVTYCTDNPNGDDCKNVRAKIQIETGLVATNTSLGGLINPYDIYAFCFHESDPTTSYSPHRYLMKNLVSNSSAGPKYDSVLPCMDVIGSLKYFRDPNILAALNVDPKAGKWHQCSDDVGNRYVNAINASYWIYTQLVGKYKILVFSGDTDSVVPITGTLYWMGLLRDDIGLTLKSPMRLWFYDGDQPNQRQVGGMTLEFDQNITFASVRGVGHMVPQWGPKKAYQMFKSFLYESTLPPN